MSRPFDFSQMPSDGVIILPELPPNPTPGKALVVDTVAPDGRVQLMFSATGSGGSGGTTTVTISDTPPVAPLAGALWFDSTNAQLFLRYDDGSSSQWVVANTVGPAAPGGGVAPAGVASFNTRTGAVTLSNADVITVLPSGTASPAMDGVASAGTGTTWSRQDHVHPTDTTLAPKNSPVFTGTPSLPTGTIAVTQAPGTANTAPATTAFVTTAVGAVQAGAVIADTAPVLNPGGLWWDSTGGQLYVRYNDGTSTAYVAATNVEGLANAATKAEVGAALNNSGRNVLHNGLFNVQQRGIGPFAVNDGYTLDRWQLEFSLGTNSVIPSTMTDADRTAVGDENAKYALQFDVTGNAGATAYSAIQQPVEDVRRLGGKTVIVSFWAQAQTGTPKIGVNSIQWFGSGGSPSATVSSAGTAVTISPTLTRYSVQLTIPSTIGKTLGTNNDNSTAIRFWFSSGANQNTNAGGIGVQSGRFWLWGVQLEIAAAGQTQPSPLDKPDPREDLANCQRFYQADFISMYSYQVVGNYYTEIVGMPVQMRAAPTVTNSFSSNTNVTSPLIDAVSTSKIRIWGTATATGPMILLGNYTASADL